MVNIKCKICGDMFSCKGSHLETHHNISRQEYYDLYCGGEKEKYCKRCGKERKFIKISKGYTNNPDGKYKEYCYECGNDIKLNLIRLTPEEKKLKQKEWNDGRKTKRCANPDHRHQCMICGVRYPETNGLHRHITQDHKMSISNYHVLVGTVIPESYCIKCHTLIQYNLSKVQITPYICCTNHSEGSFKREQKFKDTIFPDGRSQKQVISDSVRILMSDKMKKKISDGEFTPNITNSWCHTRCELIVDGMVKKLRSTWEMMFFLIHPYCEYETVRIPYSIDGCMHNYLVDFVDRDRMMLYEIKPNSTKDTSINKNKYESACKWCIENDYTFEYISDEWFVEKENHIVKSVLFTQQPIEVKEKLILALDKIKTSVIKTGL